MREAAALKLETRRISPLRSLVHVKRVRVERSAGGIVLLHNYRAKNNPRLTMAARPDYWPGIVLGVGPDVRELAAGDRVYVYQFAEDTATPLGLYTGVPCGDDEFIVDYPKDIVCAVEDAPW